MKRIRPFLGWFFGAVFAMSALSSLLSSAVISAVVYAFLALLCLPPFNKAIEQRGVKLSTRNRIIIFVVGLLIAGALLPDLKELSPVAEQPSSPAMIESPAPAQSPASAPSATAPQPPAAPTPAAPTPITAEVTKTGLDFQYSAAGVIELGENSITLTYSNIKSCDTGRTFNQEWKTLFDLSTKTWTEKTRDVSNCLREGDGVWIDSTSDPQPFELTKAGNQTTIRADSTETDGTIIVDDSLVVTYTQA